MKYELKAVVIHRGGPYGGHYHAYIKDDFKEGVWDLQMPEQFATEPTKVEKKEDEKKAEEEKKAAEAKKLEEEKKVEEPAIDEKDIDWKSLSKTERKAM